MSVERFDHLARVLAQGTSRRQVLKGFAAGLGASLFTTFGFATSRFINIPGAQHIAYAAPLENVKGDGSFLPLITVDKGPSICAIPSECNVKVECSRDRANYCICIESAENELRCGVVPPCSAPRCTSSADCAELGDGYFCDTVGSGCCGDGEQRCIAPCPTEAACPEELLCGTTCCPPNNTCQDGKCVDPVEGTWTGTMTHEEQSIGVRFVLSQKIGAIEGRILIQDPVSQQYLESGPVTGRYNLDFATFFLDSGSYALGDFDGESYRGDYTFTDFNGEERLTTTLVMQRG